MAFIGQRTLQIDIYTVSVQLFLKLPTRLNSEMQWRTHKYLQRKCESSSAKVLRWSENRESPSPPSALTGIRAAIHRHLTCAPLSRNINILQDSEFMSANKMFEAKAKLFTKENNAKPKHKSSIQSGDMQKLNRYFMEGQNTDGVWKDAETLVEFIWFSLCFHFARRGREGWRELTRQSFEIKTDYTGARYITEKLHWTN